MMMVVRGWKASYTRIERGDLIVEEPQIRNKIASIESWKSEGKEIELSGRRMTRALHHHKVKKASDFSFVLVANVGKFFSHTFVIPDACFNP